MDWSEYNNPELDRRLCKALRDHSYDFSLRYDDRARKALLEILFRCLTNDCSEYLNLLFPAGFPESYRLRDAQGSCQDTEYTEAARGRRCGHIFRQGEACYHCMTCTDDPTCVLCSRCFDASDHESHQFHISPSLGNSGCCDCGDLEAWSRPLNCAIHTLVGEEAEEEAPQDQPSPLPSTLIASIRTTIARALDFLCDIISCAPEQLRLEKTEDTIRQDETLSRLGIGCYGDRDIFDPCLEYCLLLWNDEKHTQMEVADTVRRACRTTARFGDAKAAEADDLGRSILRHSRDVSELIRMSKLIESIKVTTTIRNSRDTFREQMCGTIVEWLSDIAGCSVGEDHHILRLAICKEILGEWRVGSGAHNAQIGRKGIDDHEYTETTFRRTAIPAAIGQAHGLNENNTDHDSDEDMDDSEREVDHPSEGDHMEVEGPDHHAESTAEAGAPGIGLTQRMDLLRMTRPTSGAETSNVLSGDVDMDSQRGVDDGGSSSDRRVAEDEHDVRDEPRPSTDDTTQGDLGDRRQAVPETPHGRRKWLKGTRPAHWAVRPPCPPLEANRPLYEDLEKHLRLDSLIMFDMRLWKKCRIDLRELYISTVVNVPTFKRPLGLRFSALYTSLSQLYLIADREPDHSIINLSLQMLTSASITEEVIDKGNFLTNLMAILYTFLTSRQVGFPPQVSPSAYLAFDTGSVTNRRLYHFFSDLRYFLSSEPVRKRIVVQKQYLLQFLDLIKLSQGICPNVRAVQEHVEYETDAWIGASLLTREMSKLCRQFAEAFSPAHAGLHHRESMTRAIWTTACVTIMHCVGLERRRFIQSEIKEVPHFKVLQPFESADIVGQTPSPAYRVIDYVVEKGALSFHHAFHYTLSWLVEGSKSWSNKELRDLLFKAAGDFVRERAAMPAPLEEFEHPEDALLAMWDFPIRVCAWLAQMKAGLWVRNGMSLRHQMAQYRAVSFRDVGYHRDIFILQTALVTCDPGRLLATIVDRYGLECWLRGKYNNGDAFESSQRIDIVEDLVYLLITVLTDRASLVTLEDEPDPLRLTTRNDVIHALCFKPLSFSDVNAKLTERVQECRSLHDVLDEVATFRPPEGVTDVGTFELKEEYLELVNPFSLNYNKNQREEAESICKKYLSRKLDKPAEEVVLRPHLQPIPSGVFKDLASFITTPLFTQVIHSTLRYAVNAKTENPEIPATRIESLLLVVLQLALIAAIEDTPSEDRSASDSHAPSFTEQALTWKAYDPSGEALSIVSYLQRITHSDEYAACQAKIKDLLKLFGRNRGEDFHRATAHLDFPFGRVDTASPAHMDQEIGIKKKQALERKAKVMAQFQQQQQNFMDFHGMSDWSDNDSDGDAIATPSSLEERLVWKFPCDACIVCQEATGDGRLYGTFGFLTGSNVFRQTKLDDEDWVYEAVCTPVNLDHSADALRPFGVAGNNHEKVVRLTATGDQITTDRQGLGKGWPNGYTKRSTLSSGCGHLMHYACFDHFFRTSIKRHSQQIARHHPERTENYEFVCPLCKALGNAFLPILRKEKEIPRLSAVPDQQSLEDLLCHEVHPQLAMAPQHGHPTLPAHQSGSPDHVAGQPSSSEELMQSVWQDEAERLAPLIAHRQSALELGMIYRRLGETIHSNRLNRVQINPSSAQTLSNTEVLLSILTSSISAVETAQRGVQTMPEGNLLDQLSTQTITHLRILSETVNAFISVPDFSGNRAISQLADIQKHISRQLFPFSQLEVDGWAPSTASRIAIFQTTAPLLLQDAFEVFASGCFVMGPGLDDRVYKLLHLCYLAHIIQVVLAYGYNRQGLQSVLAKLDVSPTTFRPSRSPTESEICGLQELDEWISSTEALEDYAQNRLEAGGEETVCILIRSYCQVFLRKAMIFLHIRYWVALPSDCNSDLPELERRSDMLGLPRLDELLQGFMASHGDHASNRPVLGAWIYSLAAHRRYTVSGEDNGLSSFIEAMGSGPPRPPLLDLSQAIRLPHPAPLELIGLPKHFDVLMEEVNRRKCPTTGKELTDPALCLFCGTILCTQAYCCMKLKSIGPANLHAEK